jgi:phytoene dehydrogenase-like protein
MVIIVGGGLAGLACAATLQEHGKEYLLLERSPRLGGRIGSLIENSFTFDLGFQILLDSYPAAREILDLPALEPRYFEPGAVIWDNGRFFRLRRPALQGDGILGPSMDNGLSWTDKVRLALIAAGLMVRSDDEILSGTGDLPTKDYLRGFSDEAFERFFRPFFGGILLDNDLESSSVLFRFYFRKFVTGRALVPKKGMQAIPDQLAARVPAERLKMQTEVASLHFELGRVTGVSLANGQFLAVSELVLACDQPHTSALLGKNAAPGRSVSVLYYQCERSLYPDKMIILPTGRKRTIRHLVQLTNIAPEYAPAGSHLLSATVLKPTISSIDQDQALAEIAELFPIARDSLKLIKNVEIPYAVPQQGPGRRFDQSLAKPFPNVWLSGDQVSHGSIQGALESGRAVAQDIIRHPARHG